MSDMDQLDTDAKSGPSAMDPELELSSLRISIVEDSAFDNGAGEPFHLSTEERLADYERTEEGDGSLLIDDDEDQSLS